MTTTAQNYSKGPRKGPIRLIVIHSMESQEKPNTAETVAAWFSGPTAPQASAHVCVDSNSAVTVVADSDIAWAAPNANNDGLHIEIAGKANQSEAEWNDEYSRRALHQAAKVAAAWCIKYKIPAVKLSSAQVASKKAKGICGHITVTKAFPGTGTHTDPGKNFPWDLFIKQVQQIIKPTK